MDVTSSVLLLSTILFSSISQLNALGVVVSTPNQKWDYTYPYQKARYGDANWYYGSATYYDWIGNPGSCGMPWKLVNSIHTAAVPEPRYSNLLTAGAKNIKGAACGQCFRVKCINVPRYANKVYCKSGSVDVVIVDYDVPGTWVGGQRWPNNHFDLQPKTFDKIAHKGAGIVNIKWRRISCPNKQAKFFVSRSTNLWWKDVGIYDVPLTGSIVNVYMKLAGRKNWVKMKRLYGNHFSGNLIGNVNSNAKVYLYLAENKKSMLAYYTK